MVDKKTTWDKINIAQGEIEAAVDMIEMSDMDDMFTEQLNEIKVAVQKLREAAHEYIRPDVE
jgi:hypothetical protein